MSNWRGEPYKQTVPGGHMFAVTSDGCIHDFAYEDDYHNGPYCYACDGDFCQHCETDLYQQTCGGVAEIIAEQALFSYEVTGGATIPIGVEAVGPRVYSNALPCTVVEAGRHALQCAWCGQDVWPTAARIFKYANGNYCPESSVSTHIVESGRRRWFWDQGGPIR